MLPSELIRGSRRQKQHRENLYTITSMSALFTLRCGKTQLYLIKTISLKHIIYLELKWKFVYTVTREKWAKDELIKYSITRRERDFLSKELFFSFLETSHREKRKIACLFFNGNYSLNRFDIFSVNVSQIWSTIHSKISTRFFFLLLCEESWELNRACYRRSARVTRVNF